VGVTEDQIAEQLAELEPAWITRPNAFADLIARADLTALRRLLDDPAPSARADAALALGQLKDKLAAPRL
jgi:HEAT repeat protein